VTLVDTAPVGVSRINPVAWFTMASNIRLDVLIYATGFQWMGAGSFNMIRRPEWTDATGEMGEEGVKTFLGLHSHGFPNLFIMLRAAERRRTVNFTRTIEGQTDYVRLASEDIARAR